MPGKIEAAFRISMRIPRHVFQQGNRLAETLTTCGGGKGVIQRQSDDCAYCGDAGAVNAIEIEAGQPAAPHKGEKLNWRKMKAASE
jgi:hypothetical protein